MSTARPLRPHDPQRIADFVLTARLGEGGQGVVYLGTAPSGDHVAVKVLHARLAEEADARRYFAKELATAQRVAPFCTARVLASGLEDDQFYIVSEFVDGPSLREVVLSDGPRTGSALDRLAVATLTALRAIHQANVVHCDLKPANILIGADGPRLIDFGIARALQETTSMTSRAVGTPHYMSPEQLGGELVGPPADMFAWAGTMVYAATGKPPFGTGSIPAIINRTLHDEPDLDSLTGPFRTLVAECFSKDPSLRPTASEALNRLMVGASAFPAAASPGAPKAEPAGTVPLPDAVAGLGVETVEPPGTAALARVQRAELERVVPKAPGGHPSRRRNLIAAGSSVIAAALAATLLVLFLVRPHRPGSTNPTQSLAASSLALLAQPQTTVTISVTPSATSQPQAPTPSHSPKPTHTPKQKKTDPPPAVQRPTPKPDPSPTPSPTPKKTPKPVLTLASAVTLGAAYSTQHTIYGIRTVFRGCSGGLRLRAEGGTVTWSASSKDVAISPQSGSISDGDAVYLSLSTWKLGDDLSIHVSSNAGSYTVLVTCQAKG